MRRIFFRKNIVRLCIISLILITFFTTWGNTASVVALSGVEKAIYLPLISKPPAGFTISQVKVIQGTSSSPGYVVYVANRETMVRVFVATSNGDSSSEVTGRLCGYDAAGGSLGCMYADNGSIQPPSQEDVLDSTLNFRLPLAWVRPGFAFNVDLDPVDLNPNHFSGMGRYPSTDKQAVNFVSVPSLEIVVVPVIYRPYQSSESFEPETGDLSYLTHLPIKVFPVSTIHYYEHAFITYSPDNADENLDEPQGWIDLLADLTAVHNMEDPLGTKNYYGLVNLFEAHGCSGGCITGIGWLGGTGGHKTAVGWSGFGAASPSASETMVHELGHNFDRKHVACNGKETNVDSSYPYLDGLIGQFGLDVVSGKLYQPDAYTDFMSYCDPTWTSDYTYWNIYKFRQETEASSALFNEIVDALYISGIISPEGQVELQPVYTQKAPVASVFSAGSHQLELLDSNGRTTASYALNTYEMADSGGYRGFSLFVPAEQDLGGLRVLEGDQVLAEKYTSDKSINLKVIPGSPSVDRLGSRARLRWSGHPDPEIVYRIRLSQDGGETWKVLALDLPEAEFTLPEDTGGGLVEIQSSDGLQTSTTLVNLSW